MKTLGIIYQEIKSRPTWSLKILHAGPAGPRQAATVADLRWRGGRVLPDPCVPRREWKV